MGIIYKATSPSGKSYVGQTRYGLRERWRDHIYDAVDPNKDHCKLLNRAIRKYGGHTFELEILMECDNDELNHYEELYINHCNSIKPYGYNLTYGGANTHLEETKQKISETLKGRPKSYESLLKRSQTKKKGSDLPMYLIEHRRNGVVKGYRVTHPGHSERKFADSRISLEENYNRAYAFLQSLNPMVNVQRPDGDGSEEITKFLTA